MGIIVPVLTLVFLLLTTMSHAASKPRVILVGGSAQAWKVPDSPSNTLNHWAENNRFKVGDILGTLLFIHLFTSIISISQVWFTNDFFVYIPEAYHIYIKYIYIYIYIYIYLFDILYGFIMMNSYPFHKFG